MMTSTRETRRRALKKEGDDDNDNKVVGFLATDKQWHLLITNTFIIVHKKSVLACTPVYTKRRSGVFLKNRIKKKPFLYSRLPIYNTVKIQNLIIR